MFNEIKEFNRKDSENITENEKEVRVKENKYAIHAYTHGPVTGSGFMQL